MKQGNGIFLLMFSMALNANLNRCYTITNNITKEMTGYEFWKTKYYPDRLAISINGKPIDTGCSLDIPSDEKTVTVRYDYSFARGFRTGAKEIIFTLNPNKRSYDLSFSWNNKWRVMAEGAEPQKVTRKDYKV